MSYYRQGPIRPAGYGFGVPGVPPCVKGIMIACVVVWLCQMVTARSLPVSHIFGVVPLSVSRGAIWQPLTYMFLHDPGDPFHLLFNMLMLWMFGGELERYWGARRFLTFYLLCGLGGGVAATVLGLLSGGANAAVPTIGASGALYGLFVAYGIIFAERIILFMLIFPMKAKTMALIMVGLNLIYTFQRSGGQVSYIAHLGGALVGFLYLKRAWRPGELYRELRWRLRRRRFKVMPPKDPDEPWLH